MDDVPTAVLVIWWITLIVAVAVILPLVIYLLYRALNAARMIERYAAEALESGLGVAGNTANIAALDETIAVATRVVETTGRIDEHTGTIATVLAGRAARRVS